ncbi:MAG: tRNA uridine-5-carboxymethylaminomethyl(34) synthesis enzyme MnmG [Gemmatimonadales bacterium]
MSRAYDVIVVGGGHSGAEAAVAASRLGVSVALVTANLDAIGQMSCNPAIGGIAKGTVVREIDALGGVMGRATDRATVHFRMLNRSKGPAVWSPRSQCDRGLYARAVRSELERHPMDFVQGLVVALEMDGERVVGIRLKDDSVVPSKCVVLTAGTFLRGQIHIGTQLKVPAGRAGAPASIELAEQLEAIGLSVARFKTGTPPRIDGRSVDYERLERQPGDEEAYQFSEFARAARPGARDCWITWTGTALRELVKRNLAQSALYGGDISGRGPRYCPSIEDKIVRFADAPGHQVFLEPEGLNTTELYVNGLSTSLPARLQQEFLRTIPGLERVRMTRAGYAIEYDYYPPEQLTPWLEVKSIQGLFFAGQINGTTGYEEAAGQGLMAGINAARAVVEREPVVVGRDQAYIGVLIDDLVTKGVDEPYRLFTSRAEFRLLLRQDNALRRLGALAHQLGMYRTEETEIWRTRLEEVERLCRVARTTGIDPEAAEPILMAAGEKVPGQARKIAELARRPAISLRALLAGASVSESFSAPAIHSAEIELRYEGYLQRERESAARMAEMADFALPENLVYAQLQSLSTEARQKLSSVRPATLAQAGRIPGISPSDLQNLVFEVIKNSRSAA